jgi:propanol-preferring alcohol dehydrogenase
VAEVARLGGTHGARVTAVSNSAFSRGVGIPPGDFPLNIFDVVLNRKTIRGSIVGNRADLAESLAFAVEGKVASHYATDSLDNINRISDRMEAGRFEGRIVMTR